jgi:DNA-binding transcriptional ArsR family regulator
MKPQFHPSADDITVESILHALSDPARVQIFAAIARSERAQTCAAYLELSDRKVPKSTVSQRVRTLREAGLIRSERRGVKTYNTPRCKEIDKRFPGLLTALMNAFALQTERERPRGADVTGGANNCFQGNSPKFFYHKKSI